MSSPAQLRFTLNGRPVELAAAPDRRLVDLLRDDLGLTGTKESCGAGECGACTVLVDGRPILACLELAWRVEGRAVRTIEGLGSSAALGVLQEAFNRLGGFQCGYCTPGQIVRAEALLRETPRPTEAEVRRAMAGNICRCTGYVKIVDAVLAASRRLGEVDDG